MADDPIAGDPALLWYWSRLVGVLVVLLAISLGATDATTTGAARSWRLTSGARGGTVCMPVGGALESEPTAGPRRAST